MQMGLLVNFGTSLEATIRRFPLWIIALVSFVLFRVFRGPNVLEVRYA